ncbi:MAG: DUF2948 family protein [Geminicoccaceae bacterium]|nr:DUF2948 family protein [Geminicoccaceae bacterium]
MTDQKLRVRAEDAQDLAVIAAILQDAEGAVGEMAFDPEERRFMAAFRRYRRELPHDPMTGLGLTETASVLTFRCIAEAKHHALAALPNDAPLHLLTIATEPGQRRLFHITLHFDDDRRIQLRSDCIDCRLEDVGKPTPCAIPPCNHFDDAERDDAKGAKA